MSASLPLLAGAATAVAGVGAVLALADIGSPLRAPFTFFFLLGAPGAAVAAALHRLDPLSRAVLAFCAAVAVNLLVAQCLILLRIWSVQAGVGTIAVLSTVALLLVLFGRHRGGGRRSG